ncbi:MAG: Ig-like domain-containing protein [Bacteroidales bacterium]|nr:Ig-like domain-containing protein [Bacteroidales bacterium]
MKRIIVILAAVAAMICACAEPVIIVTDVTINPEKCTLAIGENATLTATVSPSDATNAKVIWASSDSRVATVADGVVTAVAPGMANITAKTDDGGFTSKCEVTVLEDIIHVESVELLGTDGKDLKDFSLRKGDSTLLAVAISPADATDQSIVWTSSDTTVFKVSDGLVTAVGAGKATLTAYTTDGGMMKSVVISISNPAAAISLDQTDITLYEYKMVLLKATVEPADNDSKLIWTSSNEELVTVNQLGEIYSKQVSGDDNTATIRVSSADDPEVFAECKVTVSCKVTGVRFETTDIYVKEGCTAQAKAVVYPARSDNKDIEWKSSDNAVAKVDANGLVTGVKAGDAVITVKTKDGSKEASCTVHVISRVASISIKASSNEIPCGSSASLKATITPGNATFPGVKWTSSNENVASVDSTGKVEALSVGHATIIASSCDGGFTASCEIRVTSALTSISLKSKEIDIYQGASAAIGISYTPADATDANIKWTSSDTTVVQVINGTAVAMKPGKATVTASCGKIDDHCLINVYAHLTGIELDKQSISLIKGNSGSLKATLSPKGISEEDSVTEWVSSDESVAKVSQDGLVTALKSGTCVITVYSKDKKFNSKCNVSVTNPVKSFALAPSANVLYENETVQLSTSDITPTDADAATYTWESSDKAIATVSSTGLVTAVKAGKATITAKVKGNESVKASASVEVKCHVSGISAGKSELELTVGETESGVKVTVSPDRASDKTFTATSSDSSIAKVTINQDGTISIQALKAGNAQISLKSKDQGKECVIKVNVIEFVPVSEVVISRKAIAIIEGKSDTLSAKVLPANAHDKELLWKSSDETVVKVTNGQISAIKAGTATISVSSAGNSSASASCTVTVNPAPVPVTSLTPTSSSITITEGTGKKVSITVAPSNATDKSLTWSSSNTKVATVQADGQINAIAPGTATITAKANDGSNKSCSISVTVISNTPAPTDVHVRSVKILDDIRTLYVGESAVLHAIITPADATDKGVSWDLSTSSVDIVNAKCGKTTSNAVEGIITGRKAGSARITVNCNDKYGGITRSATIMMTVLPRETAVTLSTTSLTMKPGEQFSLKATVKPASVAEKGLTWSSSAADVAYVDANGNITAMKAGTATISVKTKDGVVANCTVKVTSAGTGAGNLEPVRFTDI